MVDDEDEEEEEDEEGGIAGKEALRAEQMFMRMRREKNDAAIVIFRC